MTTERDSLDAEQPQAGRFSWRAVPLVLAGALALGAIAAWAAAVIQLYLHRAPLVLFPIMIGIGLGAMLVGLLRVAQIGHRPTLLAGAVLAAGVAIVGQHYLAYREARKREEARVQRHAEQLREKLPLGFELPIDKPPTGLADYLVREAAAGRTLFDGGKLLGPVVVTGVGVWISWAVDGLLLLAATIALMVPALRQPYCNRCRSWYRTIRSGRIAPATARRCAEVAEVSLGERLKSARYRVSNCMGGCGPARIELSWEELDGSTFLARAWLDPERREQIGRALDEAN